MIAGGVREDFELLDAWAGGDEAAGGELFERYFDALYGFFCNKVAAELADDLLQQTFLGCVQSRDRFERRSSMRAYLFGIARNVLRDALRKRGRDRVDPSFETASLCDFGPTPGSVLALEGERRLLLEALRRIPIDYQIALELYYWERLSGPELAEILGLRESGVRSRLRRAIDALREQLDALEASPERVESTMAGLSDWAAELREHLRRRGRNSS
jgi:RNA polymerase sigma-70 factor (ECF subfamily)